MERAVSTVTETTTERIVRKIPTIVVDRPSLRPGRLLAGLLIGLVVAAVCGGLLSLAQAAGWDDGVPPGPMGPLPGYLTSWLCVGGIVGLVMAWLLGRTATPRIEVVEIESPRVNLRRRLGTSRALVRRDARR